MNRDGAFSGRTAAILAGVAGASLLASILLGIFSDAVVETRSGDADSYSRSAVGHRAFVELMGAIDVPVLQSQNDTANKIGDAALVVIEPSIHDDGDEDPSEELRAMLEASWSSLVVLPKWDPDIDPMRPGRIIDVSLLSEDEANRALEATGLAGTVVRPGATGSWETSDLARPTVRNPQLISSDEIQPIIASEHGVLLGFFELWEDQYIYVLSDPDVLSNHGIGKGDNGLLTAQIIDTVCEGTSGTVIIDETLHGFRQTPSLWRALFEFPLALASVQVLLAVGLLLWAAAARFGKPAPPAPPFAPGKEFLIDNTAALARFGGHTDLALNRYLTVTVQEVAQALHAPKRLRGSDLDRWLDQVADSRGVGATTADLQEAVKSFGKNTAAAVSAAQKIFEWRQEMIHGSRVHSRNR